jgi:hypothetical protein
MRIRPIGLLLCGVVVASSACSMDATAPVRVAAPARSAELTQDWIGSGEGSARQSDGSDAGANVATYTITVDPKRPNLLRFGNHTLEIPANAICDEKSGYALDLFDLGCKSEKEPVTITALVRESTTGVPRIDLMPELRFSPKVDVTLTLAVPAGTLETGPWIILYCAASSRQECVDESQLDPSLITHVDREAGTLFRRIKHFSGYFIDN